MKIRVFLFLALNMVLSTSAFAVDMKEVEKELTTTGVEGWIHGDASAQGLFVFTYRNPTDFFDYVIMSLVSSQPDMLHQLASLDRHDKIRVKGVFMDNPSPQKHIAVFSVEMLKKYDSGYETPAYEYEAKIPDELLNQTRATFLVHAICGDCHILVLEYKDAVVPVFVKNGDLTKGLFRNDVVQLAFKIQTYPNQPVHLNLDDAATEPVKVLDSIQAKNGKPAVMEGTLILFPKSPEIMFNVFAVQESLSAGLTRQYTLVNFDSPDDFAKIRAALQAAWDKYPGQYENGRNKLLSKRVRVKATGVFNEVDPSQANPQILLKSVDSIQIIPKGSVEIHGFEPRTSSMPWMRSTN